MNPEAARDAHETIVGSTDLYANVIDAAGQYDAKVDSTANCSLAAHILNAVTVGVNAFVYEAVGEDEDLYEDYGEDVQVLAAALALHDTDKFVREAYGIDVEGNTSEAFNWYFDPEPDKDGEDRDGDPFGIEDFLGEGYRDDLQYLVQRTETRENSTETRGVATSFNGLERYCRIGDSTASVALKQGVEGVHDQLSTLIGSEDAQRIQFTRLEQPILNDTLLGTAKEVIAGETGNRTYGVVIGSSPDSIVYLGEPIDRSTLKEAVAERVPEQVSTFQFECKLTWNSFDYDILEEIAIPVERKEEKIRQKAKNLLTSGSGRDDAFERVPDGFEEYLPVLIKAIYENGWKEYPTERLTTTFNEVYNSIEGGKSTKGQKVKVQFLAHLCENHEDYRSDLEILRDEVQHSLHDDLEPEIDAIGTVVDRFFDGRIAPDLGSKDEMCFLCGAQTDTKYQKGLSAVYRTQEYSRRVPPHAKYKSICEVCNLEYALLSSICEQHDVSTNNSLEIAYFYFDDFLGDVRVRSNRIGNIVQGDGDELDDPEIASTLIQPQYFLQPVYVLDENHRMAVVRQVMRAAQESGMKVVIGRPFTRFESADAVFADEETTRPQELLGLDEAERFGPLPSFIRNDQTDSHLRRALQLFKIMSMVGQDANMSNPYLQLDRDTFHSIANFAVVNHDHAVRLTDLKEYFEAYHETEFMEMKTVAERGIDLFGKQFDSKYKKTKIFREALDAFLSGKNQQMDDDRLIEYVESQVYAAADREDYAGHATPEQAEAFVTAIREYLVENDLYDLKKLSDWENALVNSYYYAYEQSL
jgi:CRISPR-associated protein Csc3